MEQEHNIAVALSRQLGDAVERAAASLVMVSGRAHQAASGLVFADGLVLTANHVLERDSHVSVEDGAGAQFEARVAGRDSVTDLAALRLERPAGAPAALATEPAFVGQLVLALGRPSSLGPMASMGVVSAVGGPLRNGRQIVAQRFIQTDATPYPGFSGGPLINGAGETLGLLTTGLVNGLPLAIPAAIAWAIGETLARQGQIRRGYLGVSSQAVALPHGQRAGGDQAQGLLIMHVEPDSPAASCGMLLGDIIMKLDQQPTASAEDLQLLLTGERVGRRVSVDVIRGGHLRTLPVTIAERR
ncbi:MAG TPA: trypsin-like peptidase domain-containing protein [Herpetosiphonaceae bacterium]